MHLLFLFYIFTLIRNILFLIIRFLLFAIKDLFIVIDNFHSISTNLGTLDFVLQMYLSSSFFTYCNRDFKHHFVK